MKKYCYTLFTLIAIAGVPLTQAGEIVPVDPAPAIGGFYADGFGGVLFLDDLTGTGSANIDAEFDTGWLAGGAFGYAFAPTNMGTFAVEIEGAYGEGDIDTLMVNGVNQSGVDGDLGLTQVAANFLYHFGHGALQPYVGFGIGAGFVNGDFQYGGNAIDDDDSALYYQFIGGASLALSEMMSLFVEYRYGTLDEFDLVRGGGSVEFDDLNAHQAIVGLSVKF